MPRCFLFNNNNIHIYLDRRRMRCSTNVYLTALAVSDIIFLFFVFILSLQHYPNWHSIKYELYWRTYGISHWYVYLYYWHLFFVTYIHTHTHSIRNQSREKELKMRTANKYKCYFFLFYSLYTKVSVVSLICIIDFGLNSTQLLRFFRSSSLFQVFFLTNIGHTHTYTQYEQININFHIPFLRKKVSMGFNVFIFFKHTQCLFIHSSNFFSVK